MKISEVLMGKGYSVHTVKPGTPLREAAVLMADHNIGVVLCTDDTGGMVGILSERDVARAFARAGARAEDLTVAACMIRDVVACAAGDSVEDILDIMTETRCRHIPVIQDGHLLGLVSIGDLVKAERSE